MGTTTETTTTSRFGSAPGRFPGSRANGQLLADPPYRASSRGDERKTLEAKRDGRGADNGQAPDSPSDLGGTSKKDPLKRTFNDPARMLPGPPCGHVLRGRSDSSGAHNASSTSLAARCPVKTAPFR